MKFSTLLRSIGVVEVDRGRYSDDDDDESTWKRESVALESVQIETSFGFATGEYDTGSGACGSKPQTTISIAILASPSPLLPLPPPLPPAHEAQTQNMHDAERRRG